MLNGWSGPQRGKDIDRIMAHEPVRKAYAYYSFKRKENREVEHECPSGEVCEKSSVLRSHSEYLEIVAARLEEITDHPGEQIPSEKEAALCA